MVSYFYICVIIESVILIILAMYTGLGPIQGLQSDGSVALVEWYDFFDIEEEIDVEYGNGIAFYEVAIGMYTRWLLPVTNVRKFNIIMIHYNLYLYLYIL